MYNKQTNKQIYKHTKEKCAIEEASLTAHFSFVYLYPLPHVGQINWNML